MAARRMDRKLLSGNKVEREEAIGTVRKMLHGGCDQKTRVKLARALAASEDAEAVEILAAMLRDESAAVRAAAVSSLARAKESECSPELIQALRDREPEVRLAVVLAMARIRDPRYFKVLSEASANEVGRVKKAMIRALPLPEQAYILDGLESSFAPDLFSLAVENKEPEIRKSAAQKLGQFKNKEATDLLRSVLEDVNEEVQQTAVKALAGFGDDRAVAFLKDSMSDRSLGEDLRAKAIAAATNIEDPSFIQPLLSLLKDGSERVRNFAMYALSRYGKYDPSIQRIVMEDSVRNIRKTGF